MIGLPYEFLTNQEGSKGGGVIQVSTCVEIQTLMLHTLCFCKEEWYFAYKIARQHKTYFERYFYESSKFYRLWLYFSKTSASECVLDCLLAARTQAIRQLRCKLGKDLDETVLLSKVNIPFFLFECMNNLQQLVSCSKTYCIIASCILYPYS